MKNHKKMIASCLEHLRSRESHPGNRVKWTQYLIFKSEKEIKRAALVSQIDTHLCCAIQSYSNQSRLFRRT